MSEHMIVAEIEARFRIPDMPPDEHETAYPKLEITYTYAPGSPAVMYQRNGDPGWPAEPAEVEFVSAKLIDGDGLDPTQQQIDEWAQDWLYDTGHERACDQAQGDDEPDPDDWRDRQNDDRELFADYDDGED